MNLENQVLAFMQKKAMTAPGDKVLCALSGGGDSMALTHLLHRLAPRLGIQVEAAHFIHGLRPEDAPRERQLVETFCREQKIPLWVEEGDTLEYCRREGCGTEEGARALRYAFLRRVAKETGCRKIATGHHQMDNVETILFHLCRGTGARGLGGIPASEGDLIRPLLTASREEIEKYLTENHIPYCSDPSNVENVYARNRLRHQVLPLLKTINSQAEEHISQAGERARKDEEFLESCAAQFLKEHSSAPGSIDAEALAKAPDALAFRVLPMLYRQAGGEGILSERHRQGMWVLCKRGPSSAYSLPGGIEARRVYGQLVCRKKEENPLHRTFSPRLLKEGEPVEEGGFQVTLYRGKKEAGPEEKAYFFQKLWEPVQLRPRRTGDAIRLKNGHKSIKKWMIDEKIPVHLREGIPLVCDEEGPVLVCGGPVRVETKEREKDPGWTVVVRRKKTMANMRDDVAEVLLTKEQIAEKVQELGEILSREYEGKDPILVSVLKGAFVFMGDLCRAITIPCSVDFMAVSSYGRSTQTSGKVKIIKDLDTIIQNRHVIVVEDIVDSGVTLSRLLVMLKEREPASLRLVTLLDKPARRQAHVDIDYCGFQVPDAFLVGYGLDYAEKYRNLPDLCILKPEVYQA